MRESTHDTMAALLPRMSPRDLSSQPTGALLRMMVNAAIAVCLRIGQRCKAAHRRSVDRERMRGLDPHLLRDMGLSKHEVDQETGKWFWEA
jgi:uncharacterized protein YjiS (DUF1127 family)